MEAVNWSRYAEVYDLMAKVNPAYQELLAEFAAFLRRVGVAEGMTLADFGAGTGNFSSLAARMVAGLKVIHIDSDMGMNQLARTKSNGESLVIRQQDLDGIEIDECSYDAAVSVHALYTLSDPKRFLRKLSNGLMPGGHAFLCDLGRPLDVSAWRRFLVGESLRERGVVRTAEILWKGRHIATENRRIARAQRERRYWTHSHEEFRTAVEEAGLEVLESREVYRGDSDLVIARRPA